MKNPLVQHIEALIFAAPAPIILTEIHAALCESLETEFPIETIQSCVDNIREKFASDDFAFELTEMAGGFQFLTKGAYHHTLALHLKQTTRKRLSQTAMETLAIIAYKQPVSKPELEEIRGVSCDYAIQKLLEKELIAISGRSEGPGKPLLYATTEKFLDYLGINNMAELPKTKEFKEPENSIGTQSETEEVSSAPMTNPVASETATEAVVDIPENSIDFEMNSDSPADHTSTSKDTNPITE